MCSFHFLHIFKDANVYINIIFLTNIYQTKHYLFFLQNHSRRFNMQMLTTQSLRNMFLFLINEAGVLTLDAGGW